MEQTALRGGIDLGGTKIQTVVVGPDNEVLGQARVPTPAEGPAVVAAAMATALQAAATAAGTTAAALGGVGVGAPGVIDAVAGTVAHAGNIPGWDIVFPLVETLSTAVGAPVGRAHALRRSHVPPL